MRRAAAALHIAQPSLSQHIKLLERALKVELFEREARGVKLTSAGKQLLPHAERVVAAIERLEEHSLNLASGNEGVVSISAYPVHIERFLGSVIGELKRTKPGIRVDLSRLREDRRRSGGRSLFDELIQNEVDLAMGPPHDHLGLEFVTAYLARIVVLFPDEDTHRHAGSVSIEDIKGRPLLIAPPGYFSRERVESAARDAKFSLLVEAQSSSPSALVNLGANGLGLPVLPDDYPLVGRQRFPYPTLTNVRGEEIYTPVCLHWKKMEELTPAARYFVELAKIHAEKEALSP